MQDKIIQLIKNSLYQPLDPNSQIPDIDQMIEYLYYEVREFAQWNISLGEFMSAVITLMQNRELLLSAWYEGVEEELQGLLKNRNIKVCFWSQGNLMIQTQKANLIAERISQDDLLNTYLYISLQKLNILDLVIRDTQKELDQGSQLILIDDRPKNILDAHTVFQKSNCTDYKLIRKIRPDKSNDPLENTDEKNITECNNWQDICDYLDQSKSNKGKTQVLILDLDGVIYNTTVYREQLEILLKDLILESIS